MQFFEGEIKSWKDDKGFGFIKANGDKKDIFIHIRDLKHSTYTPKVGDRIAYKIVQNHDGKFRAYDAFMINPSQIMTDKPFELSLSRPDGSATGPGRTIIENRVDRKKIIKAHSTNKYLKTNKSTKPENNPKKLSSHIIILAISPFIFSITLAIYTRIFYILFAYILMSLLIFIIYAMDKTKAHKNQWRTPESTLHLLELFGGWPGALITQRVIRHKNKKASYQNVFWTIVIIHFISWFVFLFYTINFNSN